ncbi:uncharacterized protein LOC129911793 [Episyrphus balteatus]|uniref:uncharacterized protein LOC129911793 n=1 Tax=Episyrphus balteatus TaxID=286459 RepID=UPI0024866A26|nr:uncharacterized protein LOC129911793 [Episyrphus balteatus]
MDENNKQNDQNMNESFEDVTTKITKRRTLVAPWKNIEEFNKVYSWIYGESSTNETRQLACRQMTVWKIRRSNLTPAAVLGTLVILEIQLKDQQDKDSNNTPEQMKELQILYASAFTRFFNYMSSIMQTQTQNMKTMYETAKELNLRSFVVDLRHMCAHGQDMPSIEILRSASKYCLRWLEDFYWKSQSNSMQNVDIRDIRSKDTTSFEQSVWKLFQLYDAALRCCLKGEKISKKNARWEKLLQPISDPNKYNLSPFEILGIVVKNFGVEVIRERSMMDLSEVAIDAFLQMRFFFKFVSDKLPETDEELENLIKHTQGIFRMFAVYDLIEDLFRSLLAIVENDNEESQRRKGASFWANQIVLGFIAFRRCKEIFKIEREENPDQNFDLNSLNFDNTSKRVLKFYSRSGINPKTALIFGDSVRRPWVWTFDKEFVEERVRFVNEYSIDILKNILHLVDPQLTEAEIKSLKELMELRLLNDTSIDYPDIAEDESSSSDKIYTPTDVLIQIGTIENDDTEMQDVTDGGVKKYGIWSTVPDCQDWYTCPIGSLIWD